MDYIVIFLITLKTHPILSLLGLFGLGALSQLSFLKKIKRPILTAIPILFVIYMFNIFAGHFLTNFLIDNLGQKGEGVVTSITRTSSSYNNRTVLKYNVTIKLGNTKFYSTYCLSSDFNIVHSSSWNTYIYPPTGVKFNVKFLKNYPRAFVIVANDDSDYSNNLKKSSLAQDIDSLQNQLKLDPNNADLKNKLNKLLSKQSSANSTNSISHIDKKFSEKGTDPGKLNDARYIAMDSNGNIWAADYSDGRIQEFSASGKFIKMIKLDNSTCIKGLAADKNGNLYISFKGAISKYNANTGSLIATFNGSYYFESFTLDKDGNIFAIDSSPRKQALIKLSPDGKELAHFDNIIDKVNTDDPASELNAALSTNGNIYVTSSFNYDIYNYDSNGNFIKYFVQDKNNKSQLQSYPQSIAVYGEKYLYILNFEGICKFDMSGKFIGVLPSDNSLGSIMNIFVDSNGFVYAVTSNGNIIRYAK